MLQLVTKRLATPSMIPWKWYSSAEAVLVVGSRLQYTCVCDMDNRVYTCHNNRHMVHDTIP